MSERNVLLKNVKHPFLVGLHFSFQTADKLYFVLDYINGGEVSKNKSPQNYKGGREFWSCGALFFKSIYVSPSVCVKQHCVVSGREFWEGVAGFSDNPCFPTSSSRK